MPIDGDPTPNNSMVLPTSAVESWFVVVNCVEFFFVLTQIWTASPRAPKFVTFREIWASMVKVRAKTNKKRAVLNHRLLRGIPDLNLVIIKCFGPLPDQLHADPAKHETKRSNHAS